MKQNQLEAATNITNVYIWLIMRGRWVVLDKKFSTALSDEKVGMTSKAQAAARGKSTPEVKNAAVMTRPLNPYFCPSY